MNTPRPDLALADHTQLTLEQWGSGAAGSDPFERPQPRHDTPYSASDYARFSKYYRVDPSGCWLWTGTFYSHGGKRTYGQFWIDKKRTGAHRASWLLFRGSIPAGLDVMHSCDTPACVRVDHLEPGTRKQNIADARTRHGEWSPYGERHGRARLTWAKVDAIRAAAAAGAKQAHLAAQYGVTPVHISHIVRGERWNVRDRAEAVA